MAGSVNRCFFVGRLGKDPEVRDGDTGKIVNMTLACSESWKGRDGQRQERTEWIRVVCFNDHTSDLAERFLKKGALVAIEGSLQTRKWMNKDGVDQYTTEVVIGKFSGGLTMLDTQNRGSEQSQSRSTTRPAAQRQPAPAAGPSWDEPGGGALEDDVVPFGPSWQ